MAGILELNTLLKSMNPELKQGEYIFCCLAGNLADYVHLKPLASYVEEEGLTLILNADTADKADKAGITYEAKYNLITLNVHSSLEAVGLTAAVSAKLTEHNISANVVAAFYHDHIFIQTDKAQAAMKALGEIG
ncbi:ACT domain-containing protein [Pseudoalteromonas sp. Angola-18]|uniref:ACT domain-containing protein n=1 Tax=Pseudoalteromonas sp. Angola-18 TaxID=3025338 RepID=UPI0023590A61|nr:ACT domain-containing protein [Pseudoalteromonas sp. Angola-18]MDC9500662.1 ACT domain-containing protein [Pseudoalteromonas sp. Angola-18]